MALQLIEIFGFAPGDRSVAALQHRKRELCPFTKRPCWKRFRAGNKTNGTCTVKPPTAEEVICCPDRLYANDYQIIRDVTRKAFGKSAKLIRPDDVQRTHGSSNRVVAFGKRWGKELRVPKLAGSTIGGYAADWILAKLSKTGELEEFVPVEVQTMDTTGSYQREWYRLFKLRLPRGCEPTDPSINWENVNKRIIPQLLTKGNVYRREALCRKGLFFICPTPVYERLMARLGAKLSEYPLQSGGLTFCRYDLAAQSRKGRPRELHFAGQFTTTVENLKEAFNSTLNLPEMDAMGQAIRKALASRAGR